MAWQAIRSDPSPRLHPSEELVTAIWAIHDHPRDFPDHIVIRRQFLRLRGRTVVTWDAAPPGTILTRDRYLAIERSCRLADTLEGARALLPPGSVKMEIVPADPPTIVEVWV